MVDHSPTTIESFDPEDTRLATVEVAGTTALLVSKLHKIGERAAAADVRPDRLLVKDGADTYRLMLNLDALTAVDRFEALLRDPVAGESTRTAMLDLDQLFTSPASVGVRLAAEGFAPDVPAERVEGVCVGFARSVLGGLS
ncbi:MAG: hypothetical protein M3096_08350 [Actinomycetia bacterium]|nr:hypothetical protein [Actinomycetes bacterium]